jgi:hypothetical protein
MWHHGGDGVADVMCCVGVVTRLGSGGESSDMVMLKLLLSVNTQTSFTVSLLHVR